MQRSAGQSPSTRRKYRPEGEVGTDDDDGDDGYDDDDI